MKAKMIIIICLLWLQGCGAIGIGAIGNRTATIINPNVSTNKGLLREKISDNNLITSKELLEHWGKPDRIDQIDKNREEWTYYFSLRWNGIFAIIVIVPIPLLVPVGHDYIVFTIENDNVASAFIKNNSGSLGAWCGFFPPHLMGCETSATIVEHGDKVLIDFIEKNELKLLRKFPK